MGNDQRKRSRAHHGSSRSAGYAPRSGYRRRHGKRPASDGQSDGGKTCHQEVTRPTTMGVGGRAWLGCRQFSMSEFFLFLPPLPKIFLPSFPIPLPLPLPILAAPFPVPTPTSLPAPAAPLPMSSPPLPTSLPGPG